MGATAPGEGDWMLYTPWEGQAGARMGQPGSPARAVPFFLAKEAQLGHAPLSCFPGWCCVAAPGPCPEVEWRGVHGIRGIRKSVNP